MIQQMPTKLLYLEDMQALTAEAQVVEVSKEDDKDVVILDQTILYPQGGGQPFDQGVIESATGTLWVDSVRFSDGIVKHFGTFEKGSLNMGETVNCRVNAQRRALHSRVHSAGHVIDMAVAAMRLPWKPAKAFHFPEGPYVEYEGSLENLDKEELREQLEKLCNDSIHKGVATSIRFMNKEDMKDVCLFVPDYLPPDKPARVVMYGDFGIPCGGTHVADVRDIGAMTIRKLKAKGSTIRVSYAVD